MSFYDHKVTLIRKDGSQSDRGLDATLQPTRGMIYVNTSEVITEGDRIAFNHERGQETYLVLNAKARKLDKAGYALTVRNLKGQ